jgi:ferric-dicitrate binding protein FerR (iron transport regulator)
MADTEVALLATDSTPGFLLHRGILILDERMAEPIQVAVPGGYVLVQGDPQNGAQCQVAAVGSGATISVTRGLAEVHAQGTPVILRAGQSARVEAGPQQAGQPIAGRITREIPQGEIRRGEGQIQVLPLKLQEAVLCNDLVQTLQAGRAQITLLDGSTLNVGARSQIRVVSHAPDKQQTVIDLTEGTVRANVQKLTAPNPKFDLVTKSAVIGTIDTSFVAASDDKGTRVCGVDGTTSVKSSDPNITKQVKLKKKECTFVPFGGAPTDPIYSPGEMSSLLSQTAVSAPGGAITPSTAIGVAVAGGVGAAIAGIVLAPAAATSPTAP